MGIHAQALGVLKDDPGTWYCLECWTRSAGLTVPDDEPRLTALAKSVFLKSTDHETKDGGVCGKCKKEVQGLLVRETPRIGRN